MPSPILTVAETRAWEAASWDAGISSEAVITTVGTLLARRVEQLVGLGASVLVLAGKGNNGADAKAFARAVQGRAVELVAIDDPVESLAQVRGALARRPALVVDGLFGIGLNRPLESAWVELIRSVNQSQLSVLSVDVPSGLNADTGHPQPEAVRARWTCTLGAVKVGLLSFQAAPWVGRLELFDAIGLIAPPSTSSLATTSARDFEGFPPVRPEVAHKGTFGHLAVVAGSVGYHGAGVLAARGAARAKPGLVTLFTSPETYGPAASHLIGTMVAPWRPGFFDDRQFSALLMGPGLAAASGLDAPRTVLMEAWRTLEMPVVVDASSLDWLQPRGVLSSAVRVITPHPAEAARMLGVEVDQVVANRVGSLKELSKRFGGAWVVLKGSRTLIGSMNSAVHVNLTGNPGLAQGGTGDLLSGFIAGLLAQPHLRADPLKTLAYACWAHGKAADELEAIRRNWTVEELDVRLGV